MSAKVEKAIARLLQANGVPVSKKYLEQQLRTHPDYPTLSSITSLLETLGVPYAAVRVERHNIKDVPTPFIAHLAGLIADYDRPTNVEPMDGQKKRVQKDAELVVVDDINTITQKHPDFYERWEGVVLAIEPVIARPDPKNIRSLREEGIYHVGYYTFIGAYLLIAAFAIYNNFSWINLLLLATSFIGIGIGTLILQKERGHSNKLTEHLCNALAPSGCDRVLQSRGAHIVGWLKLSDVGSIYFLSLSLAFIAACISGNDFPVKAIWSIMALASLVFIIFSLFYQWRVLKTWCGLCLITLGILLSQLALLTPTISIMRDYGSSFSEDMFGAGLFMILTFVMVAGGWLLLRVSVSQKDELERSIAPLMRLKRNPDTFMGLLGLQKKVDTTPFEHDLQLGNPNAAVQIMVACNPHCSPCASAHNTLHALLEDENNDIGFTVRLTINPDNKEDSRTKAAIYMYQHILGVGESLTEEQRRLLMREVLHHWYSNSSMNLEKFAAAHPVTKERDVTEILRSHSKWSNESKIAYTPTIFLNGTEFPKAYSTQDLRDLLPVLADATN